MNKTPFVLTNALLRTFKRKSLPWWACKDLQQDYHTLITEDRRREQYHNIPSAILF